jgi:tetratricopeptide (TPR) repeat protein
MDQLSAHLDRGWDLASRGDFEGAWTSAQKILELDERSAEAHNLLGYIRAAQGDAEDALEYYRQAIDLDDGLIEAKLNAAEVLIHPLHHFDEAIDLADDALDVARESDEIAEAMLLKIDALLHRGDLEGAARVAMRLPTGPFENIRLGFMVGRAKFEVGDIEAAEPLLRAALEREQGNGDVLYQWALLLRAQDKIVDARAALLAAREIDQRSQAFEWALSSDQFKTRAQAAIARLSDNHRAMLAAASVIVSDLPGAEVVAEGVDPRVGVLLEGPTDAERTSGPVERVFIYQRNIERSAQGGTQIEEEIIECLEHELTTLANDVSDIG